MGSDYSPGTPAPAESTDDMLAAYQKALPSFMQMNEENILPYEQSALDANKSILPQYNDLQTQLFNTYGPQYQAIANQLQDQQAKALTASQTDILKNQGVDYANAAKDVAQTYDPEYFASRTAASDQLQNLLASYDVSNGLSGTEQANVERGLNRMGQSLGTSTAPTSGASTILNAFGFDDKLQQKKSGLASALQTAASTIPALKSGFDPGAVVGQALYSGNNGQSQQINASAPNTGAASNSMSQNLMGNIQGMLGSANNYNASTFGSIQNATSKTYESAADQTSKYMSFI